MSNTDKLMAIFTYFKIDSGSCFKRTAAYYICQCASEASKSGIPIKNLYNYPSLWINPVQKIATRFKLLDFADVVLNHYYSISCK